MADASATGCGYPWRTMAERQVIKARVRLFPHPNAERLELVKVGTFQLVVRRGELQEGQAVIVAPERALLPPAYAALYVNADTGASYLHGPEKNRVGAVRLRGELSQGVIIPPDGLDDLPLGEDLAARLGITFWEPPIPASMQGEVIPLPPVSTYHHHDVEQFSIYAAEFQPGEPVVVTEKLHGTKGVYARLDGLWYVTSKGLSRQRLGLLDSTQSVYWRAARHVGLFGAADDAFPHGDVQVFAEVLPVQKGFTYGQRDPTLFVFRVLLDGRALPRADWPAWFQENGVPVLYDGPYDEATVRALRGGLETVSGLGLHIREGVALTPAVARPAADGQHLIVKLISDAYAKKETGEELS